MSFAIYAAVAGFVAGGLMVLEVWRAFISIALLCAPTTFFSFALDAGTLFQKQRLIPRQLIDH